MNKKSAIITAVVIVVVIVAVVLIANHKSSSTMSMNQTGQPNPTEAMASPTPTDTMASPTPTAQGRLSYGDALNTYKNRIQFLACHGNPGSIVVSKGSPVMLDNRDHTTHTIKAGAQTVSVPGSDYELLYPATKGNFQITCDGGGAAQLNVE